MIGRRSEESALISASCEYQLQPAKPPFVRRLFQQTSENTMPADNPPRISPPKSWNNQVRSRLLHVIALAQFRILYTRGVVANIRRDRVRLRTENSRLRQQLALLEDELRIKDACLSRIPAHHRAPYTRRERMAILELRAARGWSSHEVADAFMVTGATISGWMKRVDEEKSHALAQLDEAANKARYSVQRLKTLYPANGKGQDRPDSLPGRSAPGRSRADRRKTDRPTRL
jgi:transcriptional regulator with XRE-family HTH domain